MTDASTDFVRESVAPPSSDIVRESTAKPAAVAVEPPVHAAPTQRRVRALECRVGSRAIAIPVDAVGQIVEYEVAPLPLARGAVRGLGLVDGRLVVSLGIGRTVEGRRRTRGVLLRTSEASGHWAFEVTEVLSLVDVELSRSRGRASASTADRRELTWIDVDGVVANADAFEGSAP